MRGKENVLFVYTKREGVIYKKRFVAGAKIIRSGRGK
jgi:hypothetical protein